MPCVVRVRQVGLIPYVEGLVEQASAVAEVRSGGADGVVLALRHPPVVTLGRRTRAGDVLVDRWDRRARGVELYHVDRGGGATFHYPGQAVAYPVLHLDRLGLSVEALLSIIARAVSSVASDAGVAEPCWDAARPGLYAGGAKLASVGLHLSSGVTTHGVALNVRTGYEGFALIHPCREQGLRVTSLADLTGKDHDPDEVAADLAGRVAEGVRSLRGQRAYRIS